MTAPHSRLYLFSPPALDAGRFASDLRAVMEAASLAAFLLRLEGAEDDTVLAAGETLMAVVHDHDCAFILHDRADLALSLGADGVHVTGGCAAVAAARKMLGNDRIVGAGAGLSRDLAIEVAEAGADYVAVGGNAQARKVTASFDREMELGDWCGEMLTTPSVLMSANPVPSDQQLAAIGADFYAPEPGIWKHAGGCAAVAAHLAQALSAREQAA